MTTSTPTFPSDQRRPPIAPIDSAAAERSARGDDSSSFSRQLAVIAGMLSTLDTLTNAGQRHMMNKVVSFLKEQTGRVGRRLSLRNQRAFADLLDHLTRDSERLLPDVCPFSHHADGLVALLAAIAPFRP